MTPAMDIDSILPSQDLPEELLRRPTSAHPSEEPRVVSMLSGMTAARHQEDVICPLMLRRHLVVPAHYGYMAQSAWRVE